MSIMVQRATRTGRPAPSPDPAYLELAPTPGPRPQAVPPTGGPCKVIELFPGTWREGHDGQPGRHASSGGGSAADGPNTGGLATDGGPDGRQNGGAVVPAARWLPSEAGHGRQGPIGALRTTHRRAGFRLQLLRLWFEGRAAGQHGMATAEYAIATLGEMSIVRQFSV